MLKFEGKFNVGDVIRAYDFEPMQGRGDSFIEGKIVKLEADGLYYKAYVIEATRKVCNGKEYTNFDSGRCFVPYETSMDYDHRIFKI